MPDYSLGKGRLSPEQTRRELRVQEIPTHFA